MSSVNFVRLVRQSHSNNVNEDVLGLELKNAFVRILAASLKYSVATATDGPLWTLIEPRLGSAKRIGFYDLIINYKGQLKVSSRTNQVIGNALTGSLFEATQHKIFRKLRYGEIEVCSSCSHFKKKKCSGDRNIAYAFFGDYLKSDPGCWKNLSMEKAYEFKPKAKNFNYLWFHSIFSNKYSLFQRSK